LFKKKKDPKFKKTGLDKKAPLVKNVGIVDNRKKDKVKRGDHKKYMAWFHKQGFECLECGTKYNIEADHIDPQDDRTVVPFCSYCHRGDNKNNCYIDDSSEKPGNTPFAVSKGYYRTRGTRTAEFKAKWSDEILLKIAANIYKRFENVS